MRPLAELATDVLTTADGRAKTALSRRYAAEWFAARAAGDMPEVGQASPPMQPARPETPEPAPMPGDDSEEVLKDIGLNADEIARLREAGAVG